MTTLHEAAQKAIYWLDQNGGAHIADELREAKLAQPEDADLLTIAYMNGYDKGKRDAMKPQGDQRCDTARVLEWMRTPNRKAAQFAFTEGPERQAAYWIEIAQSEPAAQPDDSDINQVHAANAAVTYPSIHFAAPAAQPCKVCEEVHAILDTDESMIIRDAKDGYPEGRASRTLTLQERVKALCVYAADWKRWYEETQAAPAPQAQQEPDTWTDDGGWTFPVERQIIQTR